MSQKREQRACFTVCVEGNIGSGKSTLLQYLKSKVNGIEVCEEPVSLWQNVDGHNILDLMYKNADRWSFTFQTYVLLTMMKIHNQQQNSELRFIERSAYSAIYCFVENLYLSGHLSHLEYTIYHQWFDWLKKSQTPRVDLFVYVRTSPKKCLERVKSRGREEEAELSLIVNASVMLSERACDAFNSSYSFIISTRSDLDVMGSVLLHQLHDRYEEWLVKKRKFDIPAPVMVIDGEKSVEEMIEYFHEKSEPIIAENYNHISSYQSY